MSERRIYLSPWRIDVTVREGVPRLIATAELARIAAAALDAATAPRAGIASEPGAHGTIGAPRQAYRSGLILADDRELASLNATHLGKRGPTDVLSFPLLPPSAFPAHEGSAADAGGGAGGTTRADGRVGHGPSVAFALPPGSRTHLGDIVVSVERAIEQAEAGRGGWTNEVRWAPADELRLLVTHGTLHVCGWDHAEPAEEAAMRRLEAKLLASTG